MGLLLYKSDEMFSSTELIRKSKSIFDKILGKKIEKAIILRDGKPSFLLMEFSKYEKIMAEYEELKSKVEKNSSQKNDKIKKKKKKAEEVAIEEEKFQLKTDLEQGAKKISFESGDYGKKEAPQAVALQNEDEVQSDPQPKEHKQNIAEEPKQELKEEDITQEEESLSQEQEIQKALERIDAMNLDDEMKEQAKQKVRLKIIQARKERALLAQEQEKKLQEEKELERQVEEEKQKKEQELEEFWD
jgi:hypothetical protein